MTAAGAIAKTKISIIMTIRFITKHIRTAIIMAAAITTAVSVSQSVSAQQKKPLSLEMLLGGGSEYWNNQPAWFSPAWWGDCLVRREVEKCIQLSDAKGRLITPQDLFTLDDIRNAEGVDPASRPYTLQSVRFPEKGKTVVEVESSARIYRIDWKARRVVSSRAITAGCKARDISRASGREAYVLKDNLYVINPDGQIKQLSTDGSLDMVYGQSVHRDEFGITKGTFWSPSGNRLAFYKMDQSMVTSYPQVNISPLCADNCKDSAGVSRIARVEWDKYPMAGETSHKVYIGVYDAVSDKTIYLHTADPTDRYFTNISWSPDDATIYVFELNRDQNHMQLIAYDAATGEQKGILFEERNDKYVEPLHPLVFLPWDKNVFLFQSRRDGYNHLYTYDLTTRKTTQVTSGKWEVLDFLGFNPDTRSAIYVSNASKPINENLYSVSLKTRKVTALDDGEGLHQALLSPSGKYLSDKASSPRKARYISLVSTATGRGTTIETITKHPWEEHYQMPEITSGTIKAADGVTDLYYRLLKPTNFDPSHKYPAIVYVYGGPHAHMIYGSHFYGLRGWEAYMAQKGYVVFVLDGRGSENRGFDFESVTFRHLGVEEMKDQIKGVDFLKSQPWVDATKLGVVGWSFGGFMTINLMCTYPDVFKVAVAGGPVIDWKYYEVMYGERYMDTPQQNPEGYKGSNLLLKAGNLKGRLEIINGYNDPTCVPQHTFSFLRACANAGTQPDYFTYPGDGHNMSGRDQVHLYERITRYFTDYLK